MKIWIVALATSLSVFAAAEEASDFCNLSLTQTGTAVSVHTEQFLADVNQTLVDDQISPASSRLIVERVEPLLQRVANFLHEHGHSSKFTDTNGIPTRTTATLQDLIGQVESLRKVRAPSLADRFNGLFKKSDALDVIVERVRRLHFALLGLAEQLKVHTAEVKDLIAEARELSRLTRETSHALIHLKAVWDRADVDVEFMRQLTVLSQDIDIQRHLLGNLEQFLDQHVQSNVFTQERIRRMITSVLPMEVMMGGKALDLSPLAPPVSPWGTQAVPGQVRGAFGSPLTIETRIQILDQRAETDLAVAQGIDDLVREQGAQLTTPDILKMVRELRRGPKSETRLLDLMFDFVTKRATFLSVDDVLQIRNELFLDSHRDDLLFTFAKAALFQLSHSDKERLRDETKGEAARRRFSLEIRVRQLGGGFKIYI